jgi:uncharacterized membrane protein
MWIKEKEQVMEQQHYVARRVGSDFVVVRESPVERANRAAAISIGGMLFWNGLRRRGLLGALAVTAGAALCFRGYTGVCVTSLFAKPQKRNRAADEIVASPAPADKAELASMASFPASDPPSTRISEAAPDRE